MDANTETALRPTASGYLESPRKDRISQEIKALVIENYAKSGNLSDACRLAGVIPRTFRWHMNLDRNLMRELTEAREQISDKAEGHMVEHMSRPNNVIDRLAWLKAWRPDRWNPAAKFEVKHSVEVTQQLAARAAEYIDTTATDTGTDGQGSL